MVALWNRSDHYIFILSFVYGRHASQDADIYIFILWFFLSSLWSPYVIGQTIIFLPCNFYLLSFFFSSPNLTGHRLNVYHTSTHGVALVRIYNAGLKCAAGGLLQIRDAKKSPKIAIWAPSHNYDGLYLRNYGTHRQSEKNLLSSNMSSTCPHNMVNFGLLAAEIG